MEEPRSREGLACQKWIGIHMEASMEVSGGVALIFQPCRAFADCLRGKVQLACLSEKIILQHQTQAFVN